MKSPGESPSAKRPRIGDKDNGKKPSKRILISPKRTSSRPKAPRIRPETVPDEQIEELLKEKTPDDKSHSVDEPLIRTASLFGSALKSAPFGESSSFGGSASFGASTIFGKPPPPGKLAETSRVSLSGDMSTQPTRTSPKTKGSDLSSPRDKARATHNRGQRQESPPNETASTQDNSSSKQAAQRQESSSISTAKSRAQVPVQNPIESSITLEPLSKTKQKVVGVFWIVTSPEPNYSEELWYDGQINGKRLSAVIEELSTITNRNNIEKIKIKLKTSFVQTTMTVRKDAEDHWEIAKSNLAERIKEAFTKDRNQQTHFQIWLEPLYAQNAPPSGTNDVENGEIDFDW
jgi:hypothetical protein